MIIALLLLALLLTPAALLAQVRDGSSIYIPSVVADGVVATPPPAIASGERVYGLLGTLAAATNTIYATRLTTPDGVVYGLVGQTPDLELQLVTLARATNVTGVKIWGEVLSAASGVPLIVVSGIMPTEVASPVGGASEAVAVVKFSLVNLYAGPGSNFAKVGEVTQNQACNITGRNATRTWWRLSCLDGTVGWIDARLVTVEGNTANVPVAEGEAVAPPATARPEGTRPTRSSPARPRPPPM
jgi:hypothetical protein